MAAGCVPRGLNLPHGRRCARLARVTDAAYLNPTLSTRERVADLLGRMTLPEKVGQMLQLDAKNGVDEYVLDYNVGSLLHASPSALARAHSLVQQTRLRLPLLIGDDCIHGHSFFDGATIFPTQLGMAASFSPELLEAVARATAVEVAPTGIHWTFSPVLCIARDLRWGRVDETFGAGSIAMRANDPPPRANLSRPRGRIHDAARRRPRRRTASAS